MGDINIKKESLAFQAEQSELQEDETLQLAENTEIEEDQKRIFRKRICHKKNIVRENEDCPSDVVNI